jgi:DNA-binding response OmpR family regulator
VRKRIIIVEHCHAINFLISTVLKKHYTITSVKNCTDAMKQLRLDVQRDLIILNIPNIKSDNFELLEHMSTSCILDDIRKVVISDSDDELLRNKTTELGASIFLTKPFDPLELHERIRVLMELNKNIFPHDKKRKLRFNMNLFS